MVIGQGSNLLISDTGLDGVVLRFCSEDQALVKREGSRIRVSGNTLLDDLARSAIEFGVGDISYCSGIPGTVGGAIAGNAGAFGQQIGDVVESVRLMNLDGTVEEVSSTALDFEYRSSALKKSGGHCSGCAAEVKAIGYPVDEKRARTDPGAAPHQTSGLEK